MKGRLLALLVLVCLSARAWDVEHDEVAQLTAEALPSEIRSFFTFDDFGILMANCHYPDWIEWAMPDGSHRSHTLAEMAESVGEEDAALLKEQGISESIDFHGARHRAVLLTMLARAFGRGDHARAAFYLSLLTHVVSDIAALNHPPLQQFARYSQFPGVDSPSRKVEAGAKNDFGFRSDGPVVHLVRERMRGYSPNPLAADWPTALVAFAADEVRQGAFAAEKEGVVAFASQPEAEAALVDLVSMQICALEDMVATAWRFRSPAAAFPAADFDAAFARESGRLAAEIDPARQAVFAGVFDTARNPAQPKGTVFIVCEPYGYLACRSLSFVGRIIVSIAARTLRDAGYAVRGVSLASVGKTGLPKPTETNAVLVSLGPGEVDDAVARAFRAYREQGGRLIALGGYDPKNVTGLRDLLERQADDAVPVSSQWGVCNEEVWNRMSVVFAGRTYPFVRNPNINGYCKPYASYVFSPAADVRPLLVLDNGRSRRVAGACKGRVAWLPEYALMPFVLSESRTFDWATLRLDGPGRSILLAVLGELAGNAQRVALPEKYHRDPGAEFALVLVTDLAEPTKAVQTFAEGYKDAVLVCAKGADRAVLLKEVCECYRVFRFPRGRIDLKSSDLEKPEAKKCLENYIRWGRYQAEPPALTRYGARVYRRERKAGDAPSVKLPEPWRLVEGDDGVAGCDSRLFYFTVEADGSGLPPPEVAVSWPGVAISSVDGATNVTFTADGVVLTPTDASGGTNYLTMVQDGAIELALHHHVEGAQHGPYGGKPLPWDRIRASDNWRAACREIFHRAGLADPKTADGASIKLYGFDSNFPNRHVDHPEHFHVMLEWDGWRQNNVGHYTLDEGGFIRGNNFLVCGEIAGGLPIGYHPQKPGETTEYVGPSGKPLFSLEMLEGGVGLVLRKPGSDAAWRLQSDRPAESIQMSVRPDAASGWTDLGSCSVADDTERGLYAVRCEYRGELRTETFRYERDTGRLIGSPVRSKVRKVLNIVNFVRGCEPRDDANRDHLDEPLREEIARNTKYGDGEKDRFEATFCDEDPAPEFTVSLPGAKSAWHE